MEIRCTFLGTGTSVGIPMAGCDCRVCRSTDPLDQRFRSSLLLAHGETRVVIDTTPEFRLQMLRLGVRRLDGVLITHQHHDHVHGLDDVRPFCIRRDDPIPVHGAPDTVQWIRTHYDYVWDAVQVGGGLPRIDLIPVVAPFEVAGLPVTPLPVLHGRIQILGYRVGDLAYIPDVSAIPASTRGLMEGLGTLVVDATRRAPHPTHLHLDAALTLAREIGARQTYLTHFSHDYTHAELRAECPPTVTPAYDGLTVLANAP